MANVGVFHTIYLNKRTTETYGNGKQAGILDTQHRPPSSYPTMIVKVVDRPHGHSTGQWYNECCIITSLNELVLSCKSLT